MGLAQDDALSPALDQSPLFPPAQNAADRVERRAGHLRDILTADRKIDLDTVFDLVPGLFCEPKQRMGDALFDLLVEQGGSVPTVYAHHNEADMQLALQQPWCSVGSDGSAFAVSGPLRRGNPHPRSFGTFPRVLGVYVREKKLLRLEDAVRKMTSLNAAKLGITDRGLLRPGMFADVTIFDPERVIDRATYERPFQYPLGIDYVIVNGQLVLDREKHTGARPGVALRHAP